MTESIPDRLAAEIKRANARMEDAVAVARAWEQYRDSLTHTAHQYGQWLESRPPLPALPDLPQADALAAPTVVDSRAQVAPHLPARYCPECGDPVDDKATGHLIHTRTGQLHCGPADPDETGVFRPVPDGPGRPQTTPDGGTADA